MQLHIFWKKTGLVFYGSSELFFAVQCLSYNWCFSVQNTLHFRYSVMAGTPAKMVEYLLETRIDKTCSFDGKNVYSLFLVLSFQTRECTKLRAGRHLSTRARCRSFPDCSRFFLYFVSNLCLKYRAVFNWVSKVISPLPWFTITALCDWLTKLAPLSQPIGIQTQTNRVFAARVSPRLAPVTCVCFEFWLACWVVYINAIGQSNYFGFGFRTVNWKLL